MTARSAACPLAMQAQAIAYGFRITSETDDQGYLVLDRKFVATFDMIGISDLRLAGAGLPNIVSRLTITPTTEPRGYELGWDSSYGLEGRIRCAALRVGFAPVHDDG